jgi:hypothetical protein
MIDPAVIVELLEKVPFQSFRICMSDGYVFDLTDQASAVAEEAALFIALPGDGWIVLSYQQMTRVESGTSSA